VKIIFVLISTTVLFLLPAKNLYAGHDTVIVTAEDIAALQAHTMSDILNSVPGISAGSSSVSIHGNYKVKVFVDGRPLNDPTSSHGGIKWEMISPSDIARIEIMRGKGGVRYGQDASGGVILITTKGGSRISGNLKTFGGSQSRYYINGNLQATSGPYQAGINAGYETTDGYQVNNDKKQDQLGAKFGYAFHEQAHISFSGDFTESDRGSAGLPEYPTPFSRTKSNMQAYSMQADAYSIESKTFLNRGEKKNTDPSRNLDKSITVTDFNQEFDSSSLSKTWGKFNYGCGFYHGDASGTGFSDQDETTYSFYLINAHQFSSLPLNFSLGLRANINSAFDNAYNPETKLTWKKKTWKATLSYSRTNNTPSFYQRYNETSSTRPNPELGMETADNYSIAVSAAVTQSIHGSMTLFHNRLSDRITYTYGNRGIGQYQNVGSATYTGGDLSFTWTPADSLTCRTNYTYLEAKDSDTDKYLPAKPKHKGRITAIYRPTEEISLILIGRGGSMAYRNRANTLSVAGYFIADFKMEYNFKHFSLFTETTNIFDKEYYYVDGLLAPPRAWFAGINIRI